MKKQLLSLLAFIIFSGSLTAQDWTRIQEPPSISSVNHASRLTGEILNAVGLQANFIIAEADVPNAMAVVDQGNRYILYNPGFIERLTIATGTRWAAVSVLAHEIGHHLYPSSDGTRPLATELEADQFSGFVMQKMGATLDEAQAAMQVIGTKYATDTHPAVADRLASIENGYDVAGGVSNDQTDEQEEEVVTGINPGLREKVLPSAIIAGTLKFNSDPGNEYYLTTKMKVVKFNGADVQVIGTLTRSSNTDYPYIIYDDYGYQLYINSQGQIFNSKGNALGLIVVKS